MARFVLQCVFVDDDVKMSRWIDSINSWRSTQTTLIGFVSQAYLKAVLEIAKKNALRVLFSKENHGKSYAIRHFLREVETKDEDLILYMDSDICKDAFDLNCLFQEYEARRQHFAVIAPNQSGDCRHHTYSLEDWNASMKYQTNKEFGVSGGCFVSTVSIVRQNFPFEECIRFGPYAPDDTLFFKRLCERGMRVGVLSNVFVHHPPDTDHVWRSDKMKRLTAFFLCAESDHCQTVPANAGNARVDGHALPTRSKVGDGCRFSADDVR